MEAVEHMLKTSLNCAQDNVGQTPLHWACIRGHVTVVMTLLAPGDRMDITDSDNKLPVDLTHVSGSSQ